MTKLNEVMDECKKVLYGQDDLIKGILSALVCKGHILVEGMPGLGKTLSISLLGKLCELKFQRIQFTPDLMPADILGSEILDQSPTGEKSFRFVPGPVFAQLLMADEINRASPRTQSALLQEKKKKVGASISGLKRKSCRFLALLAVYTPLMRLLKLCGFLMQEEFKNILLLKMLG